MTSGYKLTHLLATIKKGSGKTYQKSEVVRYQASFENKLKHG